MQYKLSCHCGRVAAQFEGDIKELVSCNCSICQRKGWLMWFTSRDNLKLLTPDDNASSYTFNKHVIKHRFCPVCGTNPYAEGLDPKGNQVAAINVRCVEDIDLASLPVREFDGKAL